MGPRAASLKVLIVNLLSKISLANAVKKRRIFEDRGGNKNVETVNEV
jgi:hypothetical protein